MNLEVSAYSPSKYCVIYLKVLSYKKLTPLLLKQNLTEMQTKTKYVYLFIYFNYSKYVYF